MENVKWYTQSAEEASARLGTDTASGLTPEEAAARLQKYGRNELARQKGPGILAMFLEQLKDYMVLILMAASLVSIIVGEVVDSIVIIGIVIINACLGVLQEYRAGKALEALKKLSAPNARVIRGGSPLVIPSGELVPGDIVLLETGDYVPADVRLFSSVNLKVEEAALTGESVPVEKDWAAKLEGDIGLGDQVNSGFMSTLVTYGRGGGIVTETGMDTIIGKIATMIQESDNEPTPLQKKLTRLGKLLGTGCLAICAVVFIMGLLRGEHVLEMFMTAISLAVAAIPEGLPAVVTIVLALGMQRMAKHNAIMKKLHAVETLGSTTVICSDKTGTLTQNQMTIEKMYVSGASIDVSGEGYRPEGEITIAGQKVSPDGEPALARLLEIQALCNDARLEHDTAGGADEWRVIGDPTEGAMIVAAAKAGISLQEITKRQPRLQEIPFDSQRKLMTTFHRGADGVLYAYAKGAPDILAEKCDRILRRDGTVAAMTPRDMELLLEENRALASRAYRVLAMAYKPLNAVPGHPTPENDEREMVFCGLAAMIDPPRPEVIKAIQTCKDAGIRAVMITGDYRETAAAIARQLGIIASDDQALSGADLNRMDDARLREAVKTVSVFARVSPEHKVRIVQALRDNGGITAMTGDGVNDAPSLKRADIGVAMGITGTDVTKESADMILTDDNFSSIVSAVEEGRVIYSNIRKFVFYLLSCNVGEILVIFLAMLLRWPIPLLPIHLLWINLLTDAFPALALGTEKKEPGIMQEKPRDPGEPIINRGMTVSILVQSLAMTAAVLVSFWYGWIGHGSVEIGRTYAFVTLILCELLRAYSARSEKHTLFKIGVFSNRNMNLAFAASLGMLLVVLFIPALRSVFSVSTLHWYDLDIIALLAAMPLVFGEAAKVVRNARAKGRKKAV